MRATSRRWGLLDLAFIAFLAVALLAARTGGVTPLAQAGSGGGSGGGSAGGGSASGGSNGGSNGGGSNGGSNGGGSNGGGSNGGSNGGSGTSGGSNGGSGSGGGGGGGGGGTTGGTTGGGGSATTVPTGSATPDRDHRPRGTRPDPSDAELRQLLTTFPNAGFTAVYESLANMPPFLLVACLEGLTYAILQIPPELRFRDPFLPDSPNQAVRSYCSRFDVRPLRSSDVSSGASSRPIRPDDVEVDVRVLPDRVEVRERLRDRTAQRVLATVALLVLIVVAVAAAAAARARRNRRRNAP
jgi:hypothetical protein